MSVKVTINEEITSMRKLIVITIAAIFLPVLALAECPEGTWPSNLYTGPGGGMYTGPGGGLYAGPGGGMYAGPGGGLYAGPGGGLYAGPGGGLYTGPGGGMYAGPGGGLYTGPGGGLYAGPGGGLYAGLSLYCATRPPLPVLVEILEREGYSDEAALIRSHLEDHIQTPTPLNADENVDAAGD